MPDPLCPTCHSKISPTGKRTQGADGTDPAGNPVPAWSDDPVLTSGENPTNGASYQGFTFAFKKNIKEIQDDRRQREIDLGVSPLTEFTSVDADTFITQVGHIIELRMSTERLLEALGSSLEDYFKLDADGVVQPPGPTDTSGKNEWTDVDRGRAFLTQGLNASILSDGNTKFQASDSEVRDVPGLVEDATFIRGIHIEDLRHPVPSAWIERFVRAVPASYSVHVEPPFGDDFFNVTVLGDRNDYEAQLSASRIGVSTVNASLEVIPQSLPSNGHSLVYHGDSVSGISGTLGAGRIGTFGIKVSPDYNVPKLIFTNSLVVDYILSDFSSTSGPVLNGFGAGAFVLMQAVTAGGTIYTSYINNNIFTGPFSPILTATGINTYNVSSLFSPGDVAILLGQRVSFYPTVILSFATGSSPSVPSSVVIDFTLDSVKIHNA